MLKRIVFYFGVMTVVCAGAWGVHHSASDATWLGRQMYIFEALLSRGNDVCEGVQHSLLRPMLWTAARDAGSLASQVVYVSPNGDWSYCASAPLGESPDLGARYRYASLTKMLTAQAVLDAMAQNALPLDTPLRHFMPMVEQAQDQRWNRITVGQLLNHSAGLDRLRSPDPMTAHAVTPWCPGNLERLQSVTLDFDPGTGHGYSNLTYCLLGMVLEKLSGQPYRTALIEYFDLEAYGIRFVDGPYLADEIEYDFRHTGFYGENYWRYLDFPALSSSAGLSGSAHQLASLLADLNAQGRLGLTRGDAPTDCDETVKRRCYHYAVFSYRKPGQTLRLWVQQGYVFGASALAVLDDRGGVWVWLGNGRPAKGSGADIMLDDLYDRLAVFYGDR